MLEVSGLSVDYILDRGNVRAVDDVSFTVGRGEFLGIVGESGCGKSTLLFAVAQLLAPPAEVAAGTVTFGGTNLVGLTDGQMSMIRWRDMSVVMQSAMNALNPVKTIGAQFKDAMRAHGKFTGQDIAALAPVQRVVTFTAAQRVSAADRNQIVDPEPVKILEHFRRHVVLFGLVGAQQVSGDMGFLYLARVRTGGMQEGPAGTACPIDELFGEGLEIVVIVVVLFADDVDQARPSAPQADHLVALAQRPHGDRTDGRV